MTIEEYNEWTKKQEHDIIDGKQPIGFLGSYIETTNFHLQKEIKFGSGGHCGPLLEYTRQFPEDFEDLNTEPVYIGLVHLKNKNVGVFRDNEIKVYNYDY